MVVVGVVVLQILPSAKNVLHLYLDVMLDDDSEDFNKLNVNEKKLFILKLVNIALEKKCS